MMVVFRRPPGLLSVAVPAAALALAPCAFAGPDWEEGASDAGSTLETAQTVDTTGSLNSISGKLRGPGVLAGDYQDCFLIEVTDPLGFNISLTSTFGGPPGFDPMMFLFRVDDSPNGRVAKALLANNDKSADTLLPALSREATDGSGAVLRTPGLYLIAISGFGSQPVNASGQRIFSQSFLQSGVIGGPTQEPVDGYLLAGWTADGDFGDYQLTVQGISGVPAPGAIGLLALCGVVGRRRQR